MKGQRVIAATGKNQLTNAGMRLFLMIIGFKVDAPSVAQMRKVNWYKHHGCLLATST